MIIFVIMKRILVAGADISLSGTLSANLYYMYKTAYPSGKNTNILGMGLTLKI